MDDMTANQRLVLAGIVIFCAFGTISWLGGRTIVGALESIEKNTEFRITEIERRKSVERRLENIEAQVGRLPDMDKNLSIIAAQIKQWEKAE